MLLFSDGLSLMISMLSLISNKYFLFLWVKRYNCPGKNYSVVNDHK